MIMNSHREPPLLNAPGWDKFPEDASPEAEKSGSILTWKSEPLHTVGRSMSGRYNPSINWQTHYVMFVLYFKVQYSSNGGNNDWQK